MFSASYDWHDEEQSILIMEVQADAWQWDDAYAAMQKYKDIAEAVSHPIYTIIIFHDTPPTPPNGVFRNIRHMTNLRPKNDIITVFVGTNSLFRTIFNAVNKIYLLRNIFSTFRFVATVEQAILLIREHQGAASASA